MEKKKLHPSVEEFKVFVKQNPKIIQEVRKEKITWKELYEDWYLLGSDDPRWDEFRESNSDTKSNNNSVNKGEVFQQVLNTIKNMDPNQVQQQLNHVNQAISAIQGLVSQFQNGKHSSSSHTNHQPTHPFSFRKD